LFLLTGDINLFLRIRSWVAGIESVAAVADKIEYDLLQLPEVSDNEKSLFSGKSVTILIPFLVS